MNAAAWRVTFSAAALMALVVGGRSAFGLFVSPLNSASGMGLASLSFALAVGQLGAGLAQPLLGTVADRAGAARLIVCGATLLALTTALPAWWPQARVVALSVIVGAVVGTAVASNGLLLGEVGRAVPAARTGLAIGLVGAGPSLGMLLLGPLTQGAIERHGWAWALLATAALALLAWPLAASFRRTRDRAASPVTTPPVTPVLREWRFWRVALSFAACGFHVSFLSVHMPGVIERCGLPPALAGSWVAISGVANIAGSIAIGLAMKRHDSAWLLVGLYAMRALGIVMLLLLPPTPALLMGFAVVTGATFMAILPPTSQLIVRHYGTARLGTLFGFLMLVHQIGSFAGIWFGGWAAEATGSDQLLWMVDIGLAGVAMALVWPREATAGRRVAGPIARPIASPAEASA